MRNINIEFDMGDLEKIVRAYTKEVREILASIDSEKKQKRKRKW